jgi:sulfate transport system ATP-binding protein
VLGVPPSEQRARVDALLDTIGLFGLGERRPDQLSGGQRQRVALARALAPRPRMLLLDEPFGAVDAKVREELRRFLRRLHDEVHTTSIFVTHDQDEAFAVADRVMIIERGKLVQAGTPEDVLDRPQSEFVARFVGDVNVWEAAVSGGLADVEGVRVDVPGHADGSRVRIVVRAYDLKFWRDDAGPACVRRLTPLGDRVRVEAELRSGAPIFAQFPRRSSLLQAVEPGCRIAVEVTLARAFSA